MELEQLLQGFGLAAVAGHLRNHGITTPTQLTDSVLAEAGVVDGALRSQILAKVRAPVDTLAGLSTQHAGFALPPPASSATVSSYSDDIAGRATIFDNVSVRSTVPAEPPQTAQPTTRTTPAPDTLVVGGKLNNRYYLAKELGQGAMGRVFKATDETTQEDFAIKVIQPELVGSQQAVDLLIQEAARALKLRHENLLSINHVEPAPIPFIVMEFVDGGTLESLWDENRRKLAFPDVQRILAQVLAGLDFLHAKKFIHRDIKPANIMLTKDGTAKIADYGVASSFREQRKNAQAAGTPVYMSPEQFRGDAMIDGRADLYSVGVMAHQLLLGSFPFTGRTMEEIRAWHESPTRDLSALNSIPGGEVFARAMAFNPDDRWESAAAMREALLVLGKPVVALTPALTSVMVQPPAKSGGGGIVAFLVLLLVASGGGAAYLWKARVQDAQAAPTYWIAKGNDRIGPFDITALRQYANDGRLTRASQIVLNGTSTWFPAGTLQDLFPPERKPAPVLVPQALDLRGACTKQPFVNVVANSDLVATSGEQVRSALAAAGCTPGTVGVAPGERPSSIVYARDVKDPAAIAIAGLLGARVERNNGMSPAPILVAVGGPRTPVSASTPIEPPSAGTPAPSVTTPRAPALPSEPASPPAKSIVRGIRGLKR